MSDDELDNLTDKIGGGGDDGMEERLDDAGVDEVTEGGEPDELIEDLKQDDPEVSAEAADELERLAEEEPERLEEYEDDLVDALGIDDNWAKRAAASALAEVGSEDALGDLEGVDMPEADEAAERIRERHGIEEPEEVAVDEEPVEEAETATAGADGGMDSTGDEGAGRALDAAKNGDDVDVDFTEVVLLQMLESDKQEPNKFAEQSLRHAVREYPDMALELTDDFADRLVGDADDLRRYASLVMHEVSEEYVDEAREHVSELVDSLGDDDGDVSGRGEEALTNVAEEYPDEVVGTVAQKSQDE